MQEEPGVQPACPYRRGRVAFGHALHAGDEDGRSRSVWTLTNVGKAIHPDGAHQTLVHGWNELGFIPQQEMSLEDALRSLSDADTVLVESRS